MRGKITIEVEYPNYIIATKTIVLEEISNIRDWKLTYCVGDIVLNIPPHPISKPIVKLVAKPKAKPVVRPKKLPKAKPVAKPYKRM